MRFRLSHGPTQGIQCAPLRFLEVSRQRREMSRNSELPSRNEISCFPPLGNNGTEKRVNDRPQLDFAMAGARHE
jgi:hypothetical protein